MFLAYLVISTVNPSFKDRPKVFNSIGVYITFYIDFQFMLYCIVFKPLFC